MSEHIQIRLVSDDPDRDNIWVVQSAEIKWDSEHRHGLEPLMQKLGEAHTHFLINAINNKDEMLP